MRMRDVFNHREAWRVHSMSHHVVYKYDEFYIKQLGETASKACFENELRALKTLEVEHVFQNNCLITRDQGLTIKDTLDYHQFEELTIEHMRIIGKTLMHLWEKEPTSEHGVKNWSVSHAQSIINERMNKTLSKNNTWTQSYHTINQTMNNLPSVQFNANNNVLSHGDFHLGNITINSRVIDLEYLTIAPRENDLSLLLIALLFRQQNVYLIGRMIKELNETHKINYHVDFELLDFFLRVNLSIALSWETKRSNLSFVSEEDTIRNCDNVTRLIHDIPTILAHVKNGIVYYQNQE